MKKRKTKKRKPTFGKYLVLVVSSDQGIVTLAFDRWANAEKFRARVLAESTNKVSGVYEVVK